MYSVYILYMPLMYILYLEDPPTVVTCCLLVILHGVYGMDALDALGPRDPWRKKPLLNLLESGTNPTLILWMEENPATVGKWFIPFESHYLQCFIVANSYQVVQDVATIHSMWLILHIQTRCCAICSLKGSLDCPSD